MSQALTFNIKGEEGEKMALPKGLFDVEAPKSLLAQAVRVFMSNQRKASARTKTRSDVAKTTAKMYKQKGTGRARHGSYAAPIFVGGGVSHGPTGEQNFKLDMPIKMRRKALLGALTVKAESKSVIVLTGAEKASGKTKELQWMKPKTLVVLGREETNLKRALRNLKGIDITTSESLNTHVILAHKNLAFTKNSLEETEKKYVN